MNIKDIKRIDLDKEYLVINRSGSKVVYKIPSLGNLRREFNPGQKMMITYKELQALSFIPGGTKLMYNFLEIVNLDSPQLVNPNVDPEYYYSEADVKKILLYGSQDEFLDLLDFAPMGVMDMVKDLSVSLPLNDVAKRQALQEKTGFNVTAAIENLKNDEGEIELPARGKTRRVKREVEVEVAEEKPAKKSRRKAKEAVIPAETLEE